jgi:APA family basic amino acid/polyamine antiporter
VADRAVEGPLEDRLKRQLGLFDATMVVAGSVIGVGIFTTTGFVAAAVPDPFWLLVAWAIGGAISAAGALTNAEMGASLPHAGGDYVYLREAFHPLVGFFAGWLTFFVVYCGTVGTLAAGLVEYLAVFAPALAPERAWIALGPVLLGPGQAIALVAVWGCTLLCWIGVRESARFQNGVTLAKIGALAVLCVAGPLLGDGDWSRLVDAGSVPTPSGTGLAAAVGVAMVPVLFTYLGWNAPVYIASELREPERTLPRALLLGTALVTGLYLLINAVFLYALPIDEMFRVGEGGERDGIVRVAEGAATALFGGLGGKLVAGLVVVSIIGCLNATVLVGARIVYAMALDRTVPLRLASVHPERFTPDVALFTQAAVASVLLLTGSFDAILTYTTFAVITLMVLDGLALFRLRQRSDLPRPYLVWGYPWVPALYVVASFFLWINTLVERPLESGFGLAIAATAFPAFWLSRRSLKRG